MDIFFFFFFPDTATTEIYTLSLHGAPPISTQDTVTTAMYEEAMGIPNRTAKNHLKKMTELGLLERFGAGRATKYKVVRT